MIHHTVAFRLNPSADVNEFLRRARQLAVLDGVEDFEVLRQVGLKNDFTHALSMRFSSQHAYDSYNEDPTHVSFVAEVWIPQVSEFLELDYIAYDD